MPRAKVTPEEKLCSTSFTLRRAQAEAVEKACRERDCSKATLIRQIVNEWLQVHGYLDC